MYRLRCKRWVVGVVTTAVLGAFSQPVLAQDAPPDEAAGAQQAEKLPADQLDALVAPIALYSDELLAQVLVASTYPLEIVQLQQWLAKHKDLKDKALADAAAKEPWDPSVQALAPLPDVVKTLAGNIEWTTNLGNAFLAQPTEVKDAIQRMRKKAQDKGNLKTTEQQKVETKQVNEQTVIVIEQSNPQVVYVPTYDPAVVYGPPVYPYPPGTYAAGMAITFGVGMMMGAAFNSGGWGYGCGWGHADIDVNRNNVFVNNNNRRTNVNQVGRNGRWEHNPQHRGGAPYSDRATAQRYSGTDRQTAAANRQAARDTTGQRQGAGGEAAANRQATRGGNAADRQAARGDTGANREAMRNEASSRAANAGGDRVGDRSVSSGGARDGQSAFSGAGDRGGGRSARMSSSRGGASMRGGGGGGRRR